MSNLWSTFLTERYFTNKHSHSVAQVRNPTNVKPVEHISHIEVVYGHIILCSLTHVRNPTNVKPVEHISHIEVVYGHIILCSLTHVRNPTNVKPVEHISQ